VDHERIYEISTGMCCLLDQQAELLDSRFSLSALSAEEVDVYAHRNDLLYELSTRLSELKWCAKRIPARKRFSPSDARPAGLLGKRSVSLVLASRARIRIVTVDWERQTRPASQKSEPPRWWPRVWLRPQLCSLKSYSVPRMRIIRSNRIVDAVAQQAYRRIPT